MPQENQGNNQNQFTNPAQGANQAQATNQAQGATQNQATNQAQGANQNQNRAGGVDLAEGAAWAGGAVAGGAVGSMMGPVGTAAGAVAGGALADEGVENAQAAAARQNQGGQGTQGQSR